MWRKVWRVLVLLRHDPLHYNLRQPFDPLACIFTQAFFPPPILMYKILLIYTLYDTMNGASFAYPVLLMYTTFLILLHF